MFQRFHALRERKESGFTLIELLVVILIIAILAAIAIPVFLRQREKGWVSQVQSALKDTSTAMESMATEFNGDYAPAACAAGLVDASALEPGGVCDQGLNYAAAVNLTIATTGGTPATGYCIIATHDQLATAATGNGAWDPASFSSTEGEPSQADVCAP